MPPFVRAFITELAWLAGCYVLAGLAMGALLGYRLVLPGGVVDIQLHNTYFVLSWWLVVLPLFLVVASPLTLGRAARGRFARPSTNVALGVLGLGWVFLLALLSLWVYGLRHAPAGG